MSHSYQKTEGVVLRASPFRDHDHILTLFTPEGMMKLIIHGSSSKRKGVQGLCIPLTRVEVVYREKGGEIFSCQEISLMDAYALLRMELRCLEAACDLLHAITFSQLIGKPAPLLYSLLCFFLNKLPQAKNHAAVPICFRLKLLKHDGLAAFPFVCSACEKVLLQEAFTYHSEGWCSTHRPSGSAVWSQENLEQIYRICACQNYQEICSEEISPQLEMQISRFFKDCIGTFSH